MKLRLISHLLGFIIIFLQFSCTLAGDVSIKEVKRSQSPDHKVDAVLIEADAGATTSTSSKIFIVKPGREIVAADFTSAVFNCDNSSGVDVVWKGNMKLVILYKTARIFNYSSFWKNKDVDNSKYVVDIALDHIP